MTSSEISNVAMTLQKRYNQNQKYLYDMKKWILELKPQISEQSFITRLDKEYKDLTDIEDGDLARATKYLKQTENAIQEIISDYNIWVNQNNNNSQSNSSNQNNNVEVTTRNRSSNLSVFGQNNMTLTFDGKLKKTEHVLSEVITIIPSGKQVKVISGPNGGVYKVSYNGKIGFINELYF